jgi:hypothetical protein
MVKRVKLNDPFKREYEMITESGHEITKGDLIKVAGEYGIVFKFQCLVTNPKNGIKWVDCFEMQKGITGPSRSFYPEKVKPVVKRGKRVKRS